MKILVETSARHVHLSLEHIEVLFGKGATLTHKKDLSQPGQFACEERVTLRGPKSELKNVIVLGPARNKTQVEVSATDARALGVKGVLRESGDIEGTPGITLVGPCGEVTLEEGVIVAKRHIHMTEKDAEELGVSNGEIVWVKVDTNGRSTIFGDVVIRVKDSFALAMHIDTDESNAGSCGGEVYGEIVRL